jgi:signal transduction histidine kinase/CheY-like chemotaxis protein/HAMP domain-containing protein
MKKIRQLMTSPLQNQQNIWQQQSVIRRLFSGLGMRFVFVVGTLLLIALIVASLDNARTQKQQFMLQLDEKGVILGEFVAMSSAEALLTYDFSTLNKFVQQVNRHPDVMYSIIIDAKGTPLTPVIERNNPYIQPLLSLLDEMNPIEALEFLQHTQEVRHQRYPIYNAERELGHVLLGLSTRRINAVVRESAWRQFWFYLGLIIFLCLGIGLVFRLKVLQPIHALMDGAQRISAGCLDQPIALKTKDELGMLGRTFNRMMAELLQSIHDKDNAIAKAAQHNWVNDSLRCFSESTRGRMEIIHLTQNALDSLAERLNLVSGYIYYTEGTELQPLALYAPKAQRTDKNYYFGEGILGQVALDKRAKLVLTRDAPVFAQEDEEYTLDSGILNGVPYAVYFVPILFNNDVRGVMELGFMQPPDEIRQRFIEQAAIHLGVSLYAAQQYAQTQEALRLTQEKSHLLEQKSTELRLAMEETERATKAKSVFLANMSHELRTPLNAILGYSEMLLEDMDQHHNEEMSEDVSKILHAGKHLLNLVNDVLDISKIESGKMGLYIERIDVNAMLRDISATVKPLFDKNKNFFEVRSDERHGEFYADHTKVRQILLNLLSNATKFCENGTITLDIRYTPSTINSGAWFDFSVTDQGIGMNTAQMETLFEAFTQADPSTTRKYGGTGLGLTISREFTRMMGGELTVKSAPGMGSTFSVRLPARVINPEDNSTPQNFAATSNAHDILPGLNASVHPAREKNGGMILVIDDDPTIRDLLSTQLHKLGYEAATACGGIEGLQLAQKLQPDAITLDVMMPDMDGWSVLSALKSDPLCAHIPVIMVSMIENKQKGYALGATDYLLKPVGREQLAHVLEKYDIGHNPLVLVVEDDDTTREMMTTLLQKNNCRVITAENGKIGLQRLEEYTPQLILLDIMMPEMNGLEFAEHVRAHTEWHSIPIVVLTAKDLSPQERAQLAGNTIFQKGSYGRSELLTQITELLTHNKKTH